MDYRVPYYEVHDGIFISDWKYLHQRQMNVYDVISALTFTKFQD